MASDSARRTLEGLLARADVAIGGKRPWDLAVHDPRFFGRLLAQGSLGFGESYMDGWWDCPAPDQLITRIFQANLDEERLNRDALLAVLKSRLFNPQRKSRAIRSGGLPYRFGDDLFKAMLDRRMTYSCAYWKDASDLDAAQEAKLDLVCRKLRLEPGMRVLDVGCGWGSFVKFAAEKYGVEALGINVSEDQTRLARELCRGLPVEIRFQDYRDLDGRRSFDRVVSIGMLEHVGCKNYAVFMRAVSRCLDEDGLFLLHTIGRNVSVATLDAWIDKYVFPNAMLPSAAQLTAAWEGIFVMEDWHNFGADYDPTLMAWHANFARAWPELSARYDERFQRMWRLYLLGSAGRFRSRRNQLWQIVMSKRGEPGGWPAVR